MSDTDPEKILDFEHIIISCPTWNDGELQEDWIEFLPEIAKLDLTGKKIMMFGMGDQEGYADNFLDALGIIANDLSAAGAAIVGDWPIEGYDFNKSLGVMPDGAHFYGLGLDQENQPELHQSRLEKWYLLVVDNFGISVQQDTPNSDESSSKAVNSNEKTSADSSELFDMKLLNSIDDKMARGSAKKVYLAGKKKAGSTVDVVADIKLALSEGNMMNDDIEKLLNSIG